MRLKQLQIRLCCLTVVVFCFLSLGCGESSRIRNLLEAEKASTEVVLKDLENRLNAGDLRNAITLNQYVAMLSKDKPEFATIARAMAVESTPRGNMFKNLKTRFDSERRKVSEGLADSQWKPIVAEYQLIREAADPEMFNDALTDPINVVADLSGGKLPRVQSIDRVTSQRANGARDFGAGSQLIGNPSYGYWQTRSNGTSFWAWYGMYSLFSDLVGGRRYYYGDWSRYRDYSYYSDYGRYHYTSYPNRIKQDNLEQKTRKAFGQRGKPFKSPYAKQRVGSSGVSRATKSNFSSAKRSTFASSYTKRSTTSNAGNKKSSFNSSSGSNFRSSSRVSRGSFFGK